MFSAVKKSQATMLAACVCRNSRQLGPRRRGAGSSLALASSRRMLVGDTRKPSLASSPQIRRCPSADSPAPAATPAPEPPPASSTARVGRPPVTTSGEQALDANAEASAESPEARLATSAAGGTLPLQVGLDQPSEVPAARLAGAGSRARGAAPTARRLSHASHDGYEQALRAAPARRGRETRKPCRRYSQPPLQEEATAILAPFRESAAFPRQC